MSIVIYNIINRITEYKKGEDFFVSQIENSILFYVLKTIKVSEFEFHKECNFVLKFGFIGQIYRLGY